MRSVTGFANHEDCLEEFNKYVQGPMRAAVVEDLGDVTDIPYAVPCSLITPQMLLHLLRLSKSTKAQSSSIHLWEELRSVCWPCSPGSYPLLPFLGPEGLHFMPSAINRTSSICS